MDEDFKNQAEPNDEQPYTFSDERTQKKIRRHLNDIKDVITENDIKNVKVPGKEGLPEKKEEDEATLQKTPGKPITPWDVLEEE